MPLIQCTECNNQISDKAATCPVCGNPVFSAQQLQRYPNNDVSQHHRVSLKSPRAGIAGLVFRVLGVLGIITSIIAGLTIIGIPIAIFMFLGSMAFIIAGKGEAPFRCPSCGRRNVIARPNDEWVPCPKCRARILVDWV